MAEPSARAILYRLIEAGQLAHNAVLVPLRERGLEPGDDALLFVLGRAGRTEEALQEDLGQSREALEPRLKRLIGRELVTRQAVGPELAPGLALTARGERIRETLAGNWADLEAALLGELAKREQKLLKRTLKRFVELLRL